jgi:nucleotidyltransferase/DNA polymerase involved in DNA repair
MTLLEKLGVNTIRELRNLDLAALENDFGRYGRRLYELSRGIDNNEVVPDRPTKSISAASNERRRRVQNKLRAHGNLLLVGMFSGEKGAYRCAESQH